MKFSIVVFFLVGLTFCSEQSLTSSSEVELESYLDNKLSKNTEIQKTPSTKGLQSENQQEKVSPESIPEPEKVEKSGPTSKEKTHPLDGIPLDTLEDWLVNSPEKLGSVSLGQTDAGALFNGVKMPEGDGWEIVKEHQSWGTQETVDALIRAIEKVREQFENTPKIYIGDISRRRGGYFHPHKNHQNGRDVDIGFYYSEPRKWYSKAYRSNLDVSRTWALIKALVIETDVELIYCDRFVIALVRQHAKKIGEDQEWLDQIFRQPSAAHPRALIRHVDGHRTHLHIRFYNPIAQKSERILFRLLAKHGKLRHPVMFEDYTIKQGETLRVIAKRYKTSVRAIRRANTNVPEKVSAGQQYKIPYRGKLTFPQETIVVPPRKIPPKKVTIAAPD